MATEGESVNRSELRLLARPIVFTAALVVAVVANLLVKDFRANRIVSEFSADGALPELVISLSLKPEAFHMLRLQRAGRVVNVRDQEVHLRGSSRAKLRDIAKEYWVVGVKFAGDDNR